MTFNSSSAAIVLLAWERGLGLPENSLLEGHGRITHVAKVPTLTFLQLWDRSVLTGPAQLLTAAGELSDAELGHLATLLRLTRNHGGRGLGTHKLYYADELELKQPADTVHVSTFEQQAAALQALCPPDDVNDAALNLRSQRFTVMETGEPDAAPLACSGWGEYQGLLASLGTLVAPASRRQGLGTLATSIAAHEALAAGLIVQWGAEPDNAGARGVADALGFSAAGSQTRVSLQSHQSRHI
ncbi:GNAT family N-acetyltransferase [Specibacter sp. NPDC057265]|uniref:GNAT family N-acetyltransferase n=1 Tax=Specibacter sp. NPDC057265 TaxID=3346075 RepID=UPI0036370301